MTNTAGNIVLGSTGTVYIGATSATAPTTATSGLTGYTELGFLGETGVSVSTGIAARELSKWGDLRPSISVVQHRTVDIELTLLEFTKSNVLTFVYGGGTYSGGTFTPPNTSSPAYVRMVVDWQDGSEYYRLYFSSLVLTQTSTIGLSRNAPVDLQVSASLLGVSAVWKLFTP